MLIIRKEQMEIFEEHALNRFIIDMMKHLRTIFPHQTEGLEDQEMRDKIQNGMEKAEEYNISEEEDIKFFLECVVMFGLDFDEKFDWAKDILSDNDIDAATKIDMLDEHIVLNCREN